MKSKELRIGNLIQDEFGKAEEVWAIDKYKVQLCSGAMYIKSIKDISGIPISEIWFDKAGFNRKDDGSVSAQFMIGVNPVTHDHLLYLIWLKSSVDYSFVGFPFYRNGHHEIKYVHQLQNLYFALTGEELEIKI